MLLSFHLPQTEITSSSPNVKTDWIPLAIATPTLSSSTHSCPEWMISGRPSQLSLHSTDCKGFGGGCCVLLWGRGGDTDPMSPPLTLGTPRPALCARQCPDCNRNVQEKDGGQLPHVQRRPDS